MTNFDRVGSEFKAISLLRPKFNASEKDKDNIVKKLKALFLGSNLK